MEAAAVSTEVKMSFAAAAALCMHCYFLNFLDLLDNNHTDDAAHTDWALAAEVVSKTMSPKAGNCFL